MQTSFDVWGAVFIDGNYHAKDLLFLALKSHLLVGVLRLKKMHTS